MSDTESAPVVAPAAAAAAPKKAPAAKKASKPAKPAEHPKYSEMVAAAVAALKERKGSSMQAIKKYIISHYKVEEKSVGPHLRSALKRGVSSGQLNQVKGTGASGSFKLSETAKAVKPKEKEAKSPKKAATPKKAAAKKVIKSPAKKVAKKPSARKTPTKSPKQAAKKAAKSPAKKPVAKKAAKKPAAKKAAPAKK